MEKLLGGHEIRSIKGYTINEDEWDGKAVRLVTAWNTKDNDVDEFLNILNKTKTIISH